VQNYPGLAGGGALAVERNRVLRNTYWLLALSMVPTVLGAWIGVQTGIASAMSPMIGLVVFLVRRPDRDVGRHPGQWLGLAAAHRARARYRTSTSTKTRNLIRMGRVSVGAAQPGSGAWRQSLPRGTSRHPRRVGSLLIFLTARSGTPPRSSLRPRGRPSGRAVLRLVTKPAAALSTQTKGVLADPDLAGNVGYGILRQFDITFDYANAVMYFEKNANFGQPDAHDRAGMWIERAANGFTIVDVVAGGPAARAGLKAGEVVVAVNGKRYTALPLARARAALMGAPGTRIALTLASGAQRVVTLRELI